MATQVCPECKAVYSVAADEAITPARCSKCTAKKAARAPSAKGMLAGKTQRIGTTPLPKNSKKPATPTTPTTPTTPAGVAAAETLDAADTFVGDPEILKSGKVAKPAANVPLSKVLGPYQILSEIGRGGMGVVLKGRDDALKRDVAIKTLLPDARQSNSQSMRFIMEAQIAGQLEHPGIVPVHFLSWDETGAGYFSMKLVSGTSLYDLLARWHKTDVTARTEYPLTRLLSIFERVCEAIDFAHSHRVIHRDLKPANVMIGEHGEVWVLDWGLAKVLGAPEIPQDEPTPRAAKPSKIRDSKGKIDSQVVNDGVESNLTMDGTIVGTPGYMAPEQVAGDAIDERVDVFGLGALLYEILTGQTPYKGKTVQDVLVNTARGKMSPIPRTVHGHRLPRALVAITAKCLRRKREERYASVADLLRDLRAYADGDSISALPDSPAERFRRFARRNARGLILAGAAGMVLLTVIIIAGVVVGRQQLETKNEREQRLQADLDKELAQRSSAVEHEKRLQAELDAQKTLNASAEKNQKRVKAFAPYAQATDLLMRGQLLDKAASLLGDALTIDPEFEEAQYALGEALRFSGRPEQAAAAYMRADALSRKLANRPNLQALLAAGFNYDSAGLYVQAEDAFTLAEKEGANDPLAMVGHVFRCGNNSRFNEALTVAEKAVQAGPHFWETHLGYGYALERNVVDGLLPKQPAIDNAIAELRKARELSPKQSVILIWLANALSARGNPEDAKECRDLADLAIEVEPQNAGLYTNRARANMMMGNLEAAEKDLAVARRLGVTPSLLLVYEAEQASAKKDPEKAFQALGRIVKETHGWPVHVGMWLTMGLSSGHRKELSADLDRYFAQNPDYWQTFYIRASLKSEEKNWTGAITEAKAGLKLVPFNKQLLWAVTMWSFQNLNFIDALEADDHFLACYPQVYEAKCLKAQCLVQLKKYDETAELLKRMKQEHPEHSGDIEKMETQLQMLRAQKH